MGLKDRALGSTSIQSIRTLRLDDTIQETVWSKNEEEKDKEVGAKDGAWGLLQHGQGEETPKNKIRKKW